MRIFDKRANKENVIILKELPSKIIFRAGATSLALFSEGKVCSIGCLNCVTPKCMYFDEQKVKCSEVEDFSNDQTLNVCPVNALSWNVDLNIPTIDRTKCIVCGNCMNQCPVGAIYFDDNVKINLTHSAYEETTPIQQNTLEMHQQQILELEKVPKDGYFIVESDSLFQYIYGKLLSIGSTFHNIIARNLLISLGCHSAMRRIGDVYTRMDAIYSSEEGCFGAVEVEFGKDTLEASRAILDDIAVLSTRYGILKENNSPLVICLQLPNVRQGYWQVVKDVKNVENISIRTITIGALMLLNWNRYKLSLRDYNFYYDYDNMNLRTEVVQQLKKPVNLSNKFLGILEPNK